MADNRDPPERPNFKKTNSFQSWRSAKASDRNTRRLERFATEPLQNPVRSDNLDDFGFVSKGDDRLKDHLNQERYHKHTTQKYLSFCGTSASSDALESEFATLAITPLNRPSSSHSGSTSHLPSLPATHPAHPANPANPISKNAIYATTRNAELSSILLCMRKLREGIVASRRLDTFALDVFKTHIRAAILVQQIDSYHPALLQLLYQFHPRLPLSPLDVHEFASYHMLHLAARQEDYGAAFAIRREFNIADGREVQALHAMVRGNYWSYRAARNRVDQYIGRLMDYAEERMRGLMLKCVGATYFTIDLKYLELVAGMEWERLKEVHGVGWEREGGTITVRRPKLRSRPQPTKGSLDTEFKAWD